MKDKTGAFSCRIELQLMRKLKAFYISSFHQALSAPVMSIDVSQVGVALFPSF
jgi:hypothetical protein